MEIFVDCFNTAMKLTKQIEVCRNINYNWKYLKKVKSIRVRSIKIILDPLKIYVTQKCGHNH